jgi:hypothetical protein
MVLLIIISIILLLILWTIFAPLILKVNTSSGYYSMGIPGIFKIRLIMDEDLFHLRARIFFIPFSIHPFRTVQRERKKEKTVTKRMKGNLAQRLKALKELLMSFRVKHLYLDIDTEDVLMNAYLVPVFLFMRTDRIQCCANYEERNLLILDLRNRLANFIWIGIKYLYRSYVKP